MQVPAGPRSAYGGVLIEIEQDAGPAAGEGAGPVPGHTPRGLATFPGPGRRRLTNTGASTAAQQAGQEPGGSSAPINRLRDEVLACLSPVAGLATGVLGLHGAAARGEVQVLDCSRRGSPPTAWRSRTASATGLLPQVDLAPGDEPVHGRLRAGRGLGVRRRRPLRPIRDRRAVVAVPRAPAQPRQPPARRAFQVLTASAPHSNSRASPIPSSATDAGGRAP